MVVALGADHAGFELKDRLAVWLREAGHRVEDLGTYSAESIDYPDPAAAVAREVAAGEADRGVLVCGTGLGMTMTANRFRGVRAATCNDLYCARMAREHNDANVVAIGSRVVGEGVALEILRLFVETPFAGGRHQRRVDKIHAYES